MLSPIDSLANMEYMLYGGRLGANLNCPSYLNGYRGGNISFYGNNSSYYNSYNVPNYNAYLQQPSKDIFTSQANTTVSNETSQTSFGASQTDLKILEDYYLKCQAPSESLTSCVVGGAAFGAVQNARTIVHPFNSAMSVKEVEKMFIEAGVKKEGTELFKLWKNPETHKLMQDAYTKAHRLECANPVRSRLPIFKKQLDKGVYDALKSELQKALASGDKQAIAEVTAKIDIATSAKTGWLPKAWKSITGGELASPAKLIGTENSAAITKAAAENIEKSAVSTLGGHLKHGIKGCGGFGGLMMMGCEFLMDIGKIKTAFNKDNSTGMKQLGQTAVKGAGSLIGWTAGEAVGAWAGAKAGAALGTMIAPGVGSVIGAVAGLIGGSIGCALMGKFTHSILGNDVGSKVEVSQMKKTPQGQAQLLMLTAQHAQDDKNLDPKVLQALNNVATACGSVA